MFLVHQLQKRLPHLCAIMNGKCTWCHLCTMPLPAHIVSRLHLKKQGPSSHRQMCMNNQWTTSPWKKAGLDVMQSHPMHRTRLGQYQASSATLDWPGDGGLLSHAQNAVRWLALSVCMHSCARAHTHKRTWVPQSVFPSDWSRHGRHQQVR